MNTSEQQLLATQQAFDSVAPDYDGPRGNNEAIQDMRAEMWRWLDASFPAASRLIDLGCGTGLDAVRMAQCGHSVAATDWSPRMVARTAERGRGLDVQALHIGAHELHKLDGSFDGAYSNLGPLNCVPDLAAVSRECARLLKPGGRLVFTVIGRVCPWEIAHYASQRRWARIKVRFARGVVAVGMNERTIWTRYFTPAGFYRDFAADFTLEQQRGLCLFAPPPYLGWVKQRYPKVYAALWRLDRQLAAWPVLRSMGDHFLIVMKRREYERSA